MIGRPYVDRRIYFCGVFRGKYRGRSTGVVLHGKHPLYNIDIYEGVVEQSHFMRHDGEPETHPFGFQESAYNAPLPGIVFHDPNGDPLSQADVKDVRLRFNDLSLFNNITFNDRAYGEIRAEVTGWYPYHPEPEKFKTITCTGNTESRGRKTREERFYSDGSRFWSDWDYLPRPKRNWRLPDMQWVSNFMIGFIAVFALLFIRAAIIGISGISIDPKPYPLPVDHRKDDPREVTTVKDSIVDHLRIWNDYEGQEHQGHMRIHMRDHFASHDFRESLNVGYDQMLADLTRHDSLGVSMLYPMLDSIQGADSLGQEKFAELIVSCIQDIPYVLVLDGPADASYYGGGFVRDYLLGMGEAVGNVKHGIHAPCEFVKTLQGDCDTRTLLCYTALDHYGYNVAILSSQPYCHSILAIDLPYEGLFKEYNGARYYCWETTALSMKPGQLSPSVGNMKHWEVSLCNMVSPS